MMPKWVVPALLVALGLLVGNCWRQDGRHTEERRQWKAERKDLLRSVDSVVTLTTVSLQAAERREATLVADVQQLNSTVAALARQTDSVRVITVGALTPDASVSDSLQAYKALTVAMEVELNGVPGDSVNIGLRRSFVRQQEAFVKLTNSHAELRRDVATLQTTLKLTTDLLKTAPLKGDCRIPLLPVKCETVLIGALILVAK